MPIDSTVFFSVLKDFTSKSHPTVPPAAGWQFSSSPLLPLPPSAETLPQFPPNCSEIGIRLGNCGGAEIDADGERRGGAEAGRNKRKQGAPDLRIQARRGRWRESPRPSPAGTWRGRLEQGVDRRTQAWRTSRACRENKSAGIRRREEAGRGAGSQGVKNRLWATPHVGPQDPQM